MPNTKINQTWFVLSGKLSPLSLDSHAIRFSQAFAKKIILTYTKKGDKVFDPFAGFGTTLFVAQELGRIGYGIEYDKNHYTYIKDNLKSPSVIIHGSALKLSSYPLPQFDLCFTSPPYMRSFDKEDPFSNYTQKGNYKHYLRDITKVYRQIQKVMKQNALIVVEVANTFEKGHPMTPLAWDVGKELSKIFFLENEFIYCIQDIPKNYGTSHSHVLVFRNKK